MKQGLTKNDSLAIKGLAILLLLYHHLYQNIERFENFDISFAPLGQELAMSISIMCKICVSIFAFITGYGLLKSISRVNFNRKEIFKWNITRLVKTLSGFWFIYTIAFIVTMAIDKLPVKTYFAKGETAGIMYIINDFLGLAGLFDTPTLCATWWYMSAAIVFILIIPLVYIVSKRVGYLPVLLVLSALPRLMNVGYPGGTNIYTFVFPVIFGMIFADYNLFEKIEKHSPKNKYAAYILHFVLFEALTVGSYYIHASAYNRIAAWELNYGLIPVFFICFFRFCIVRIPILKQTLKFIGVHSMTIFLTHTFIRHTYLNEFVYTSSKNFLGIFAVLFAMSLVLALILDYFKKLCRYDKLINKMLDKFNKKLETKEKEA